MNYLNNIDKQIAESKRILESLHNFKKTKLKYINPKKDKRIKPTRKQKLFKNNVAKKDRADVLKIRAEKRDRKYLNRIPKQYKVYIISHWWEDRKTAYYLNHKKQCVACGSSSYIVLHHLLYKDYGLELDENLVPLCHGCHEEFHSTHKTKKDLRKETSDFIVLKHELEDFPILNN